MTLFLPGTRVVTDLYYEHLPSRRTPHDHADLSIDNIAIDLAPRGRYVTMAGTVVLAHDGTERVRHDDGVTSFLNATYTAMEADRSSDDRSRNNFAGYASYPQAHSK